MDNMRDSKNLIKSILKEQHLTMKEAVERYNSINPDKRTSPQNLSNKLTKNSIRYCEMIDLIESLGYEVFIKNTDGKCLSDTSTNQDNFINTIADQGKDIYVHCRDAETAKRFLSDCELDGILFDNGEKPTEKDAADLFQLLPNKRMCYVGAIGHIRWQTDPENIIKIEY